MCLLKNTGWLAFSNMPTVYLLGQVKMFTEKHRMAGIYINMPTVYLWGHVKVFTEKYRVTGIYNLRVTQQCQAV
jgi:hypothetical protein